MNSWNVCSHKCSHDNFSVVLTDSPFSPMTFRQDFNTLYLTSKHARLYHILWIGKSFHNPFTFHLKKKAVGSCHPFFFSLFGGTKITCMSSSCLFVFMCQFFFFSQSSTLPTQKCSDAMLRLHTLRCRSRCECVCLHVHVAVWHNSLVTAVPFSTALAHISTKNILNTNTSLFNPSHGPCNVHNW